MDNNIDLTLRSIRGIARRPGGLGGARNDTTALSGIKAYVSFSGSIPKMKISSFAMCPESESLVIESNTSKTTVHEDSEHEMKLEKRHFLDIAFTDPLQEKRINPKKSSDNSSSSEISSSSYTPHLQFILRGDVVKGGIDVQACSDDDKTVSRRQNILKLHIVFRSVDGDYIAEGAANLRLSDSSFDDFPLILDLPLIHTTKVKFTNITKNAATNLPQIIFDESASIRVHLNNSTKRHNKISSRSIASNEFFLSDNVDEIELRGMVAKIHEDEDMQKVHYDATKSSLFGSGNTNVGKRRLWTFGCSGAMDINQSIESFFGRVRGFQMKCTNDEDRELFTNTTMVSTIVTRESLKI